MEENSEQRLEQSGGGARPAAPSAETPDSIATQRALARLLRKRVKKFVALAPQMRADANPKTVHDVRVWSRRLQQAVAAFFPKPRTGKARRLRRTPRRIRRALGEWRNCDVLLEIVARRERRARSEEKQRAWTFVRDYLLQKRSKEVARAAKKLCRRDLKDYAALAERLLAQPSEENPAVLMQRLTDSVAGAWSKWQSALDRAKATRAAGDLHAFRIATKDLRYRTELLYDVGHGEMKPQLKRLADLQDVIGVWHDRQVLQQAVVEAVARPEILLHELPTARILLAELETERIREAQDIEKMFLLAMEPPGRQPRESSSANSSTQQASSLARGMKD